jgi:uncharacterized repeat protein (TIGR03803 family)
MSGRMNLLFAVALGIAVLAPAASIGQTLQSFVLPSGPDNNPAPDGATPSGGVIKQAGYLYGTAPSGGDVKNPLCGLPGCGTVFRVNVATGKLSAIYKFCSRANCADGAYPMAGLVYKNGAYYGTTLSGGTGDDGVGAGTVFKLAPPAKGKTTWKETVLYNLCSLANCADGNRPLSTLVFDKSGNLYGTTVGGSPEGGYGTVFKLNPTSGVLATLYTFSGGADGANPTAGVVFGKGGMLFGTTEYGGISTGTCGSSYSNGTVFELDPTTGKLTTILAFPTESEGPCWPLGRNPIASLAVDSSGTLYGTTPGGGANAWGVAYELVSGKKGAWTATVLYNFTAGNDGYNPAGPLVFDTAGLLYGTTESGGSGEYSAGTVFQLDPATQSLSTLYSFDGIPPQGCPPNCDVFYPNGESPVGALSVDSQTGAIYGTTTSGGSTTADNCFDDFDSGCGTVFVLTP